MENLMIYLLKSAGVLSIFYIAYLLLLKNETFFSDNRKFLLGGIFASFVLPALYFTRTIFVQPPQVNYFLPSPAELPPVPVEQAVDWWQMAGIFYFIIFSFLLLKFIIQLFKVIKLVNSKDHYKDGNFRMIETSAEGPFSFFNYIIFNPGSHSVEELRLVLKHEKVHARQWHSVDILISHLVCCVLWFNPFSWLYRKNITENLEFIADKETVTETASKKEYLHTLVKVTIGEFQPALTNSFYQPFIKKRIMMLNKKTKNHNNIWKMGIVLPALLAFMLAFNVRTEAQVIRDDKDRVEISEVKVSGVVTRESTDEDLAVLKKILEKRNVSVDFSEVKRNTKGYITAIKVDLLNKKTNTTGNYSVSDSKGISPFEIFVKENGQTGFESLSETVSGNLIVFTKLGKDPLYVVNGKEYTSTDLNGKAIQINDGLKVLDSKEGNKKYGSKANGGVVIVSEGNIIDDLDAEVKEIDSQEINFERTYLQIIKGEKPKIINLNHENSNKNVVINVQKNGVKVTGKETNNVTYIVNGKPSTKTVVTQISPEKVENVTVYKGAHAQAIYGSGAKDGAILVTTKNSADSTGAGFSYTTGRVIVADTASSYQTRNYYPTKVSFTPNDSTSTNVKILSVSGEEGEEPLYVVDGKVMPAGFDPEEIEASKFDAIMVLKGDSATEKYGEKGKNGVIEINTKGEKNRMDKKDKKEKNKKD